MSLEPYLCSICQVNTPKYVCPSCKVRTCSAECVKRHKKQTECSGLVDQTRFISKKEIGEKQGHIDRDYNFLSNINRRIQLGKGDVKENARVVFKRPFKSSDQRREKRFKSARENGRDNPAVELVNKRFPEGTNTSIKRQNTLVIHAPSGMVRSTSNKSGYDKKSGSFAWTVEWIVVDSSGTEVTRFLSYKVKENTSLVNALPYGVINNHDVSIFSKENVEFYLESIVRNDKRKVLIPLNKDSELTSCLKDKIVLEYPSIVVKTLDGTVGDCLVRDTDPYGIEEHSDASSVSHSDSESSSGSSSDSSSDSESTSDDSESDSFHEESNDSSSRAGADLKTNEKKGTSVELDTNLGVTILGNAQQTSSDNEDSEPEENSSKPPIDADCH